MNSGDRTPISHAAGIKLNEPVYNSKLISRQQLGHSNAFGYIENSLSIRALTHGEVSRAGAQLVIALVQ